MGAEIWEFVSGFGMLLCQLQSQLLSFGVGRRLIAVQTSVLRTAPTKRRRMAGWIPFLGEIDERHEGTFDDRSGNAGVQATGVPCDSRNPDSGGALDAPQDHATAATRMNKNESLAALWCLYRHIARHVSELRRLAVVSSAKYVACVGIQLLGGTITPFWWNG